MSKDNAVVRYAAQQGLEPRKVGEKLMRTVMPKGTDPEDLVVFMGLSERHGLDPLLGECYAFPTQQGGVRMVIGVDGWSTIMNRHPEFNGVQVEPIENEEGQLQAMRATLHRKDRDHPIVIEERLVECRRGTKPWQSHPYRMLRHKVIGQVCRLGLGITGVMDEDEAERVQEATQAPQAASVTLAALRAPQEPSEPPEAHEEPQEPLEDEPPTEEEMAAWDRENDRKAGLYGGEGDAEGDPG